MVVYSCQCLNVQVFGQEALKQLQGDALRNCPLGAKGLLIELVDPGFNFVHKSLVHRQKIDPWTEYICVPCRLRTHAVNVKANQMVVNKDLVVGLEAVEAMKARPEYSKAFGLLINSKENINMDTGVELQSHEALQKQLVEMQSVVGAFLKEQETAMERRIRKYEQEQRLMFDRLTERAREEKTKLVSILFQASERSESSTPNKNQSKSSHMSLSHSRSADGHPNPLPPHNVGAMATRRMRESSPDVFSMEQFDIDVDEDSGLGSVEGTGPHSRPDPDDFDDEPLGRGRSSRVGAPPLDDHIEEVDDLPFLSTSVPISMPAQHFRNHRTHSTLDDDFQETAEFSDIPRHIQQLSESIQERDRYIFGDRPRQRVHTGDFTQVKWNL